MGERHPRTLTEMKNLALLLEQMGEVEEAEQMYRAALVGRREVLGPQHPHTIVTMEDFAGMLRNEGREDEAAALEREYS